MRSPPDASHQQPITPSSHLPNLLNSTLRTMMQPPTQHIYAPFQSSISVRWPKKKCMVSDCPVLDAPFMWHQHMSLHASGYYFGEVLSLWLEDQHLLVCRSYRQLVSISKTASQSQCCKGQAKSPAMLPAVSVSSPTEPNQGLPCFEEVCQLHLPVLRFVLLEYYRLP